MMLDDRPTPPKRSRARPVIVNSRTLPPLPPRFDGTLGVPEPQEPTPQGEDLGSVPKEPVEIVLSAPVHELNAQRDKILGITWLIRQGPLQNDAPIDLSSARMPTGDESPQDLAWLQDFIHLVDEVSCSDLVHYVPQLFFERLRLLIRLIGQVIYYALLPVCWHIAGSTRSGKSTFLKAMLQQAIFHSRKGGPTTAFLVRLIFSGQAPALLTSVESGELHQRRRTGLNPAEFLDWATIKDDKTLKDPIKAREEHQRLKEAFERLELGLAFASPQVIRFRSEDGHEVEARGCFGIEDSVGATSWSGFDDYTRDDPCTHSYRQICFAAATVLTLMFRFDNLLAQGIDGAFFENLKKLCEDRGIPVGMLVGNVPLDANPDVFTLTANELVDYLGERLLQVRRNVADNLKLSVDEINLNFVTGFEKVQKDFELRELSPELLGDELAETLSLSDMAHEDVLENLETYETDGALGFNASKHLTKLWLSGPKLYAARLAPEIELLEVELEATSQEIAPIVLSGTAAAPLAPIFPEISMNAISNDRTDWLKESAKSYVQQVEQFLIEEVSNTPEKASIFSKALLSALTVEAESLTNEAYEGLHTGFLAAVAAERFRQIAVVLLEKSHPSQSGNQSKGPQFPPKVLTQARKVNEQLHRLKNLMSKIQIHLKQMT